MQIKSRSEQLIKLVKALLGILYIVMGVVIFLIRADSALASYPEFSKIAFSVLLVAYGFFRLYRVFFTEMEEDYEEE